MKSCTNAPKDEYQPITPLGSRLAARFAGRGLDHEISEFHGDDEARAATFDE